MAIPWKKEKAQDFSLLRKVIQTISRPVYFRHAELLLLPLANIAREAGDAGQRVWSTSLTLLSILRRVHVPTATTLVKGVGVPSEHRCLKTKAIP
jgi:hypothetical protein